MPALTWVDLAFVLALVGVAAALRATRLPAPGLWHDDAWVGVVNRADTFEEIRLVGLTSPGYTFLLKGWLSLFGFTELNAQLPALVLGIATPPLAYGLLVWKGVHRVAAGTGALLLAVSTVHIRYSDRVKQFTLDGVVSLGLIAVFWWLLDDVRSARRWGWAALAAVGRWCFRPRASPSSWRASASRGACSSSGSGARFELHFSRPRSQACSRSLG